MLITPAKRIRIFAAVKQSLNLSSTMKNQNHQYLYHPKNTMCAIFTKAQLPTAVFDEMEIPQKIFELKIDSKTF